MGGQAACIVVILDMVNFGECSLSCFSYYIMLIISYTNLGNDMNLPIIIKYQLKHINRNKNDKEAMHGMGISHSNSVLLGRLAHPDSLYYDDLRT